MKRMGMVMRAPLESHGQWWAMAEEVFHHD